VPEENAAITSNTWSEKPTSVHESRRSWVPPCASSTSWFGSHQTLYDQSALLLSYAWTLSRVGYQEGVDDDGVALDELRTASSVSLHLQSSQDGLADFFHLRPSSAPCSDCSRSCDKSLNNTSHRSLGTACRNFYTVRCTRWACFYPITSSLPVMLCLFHKEKCGRPDVGSRQPCPLNAKSPVSFESGALLLTDKGVETGVGLRSGRRVMPLEPGDREPRSLYVPRCVLAWM